MKKGWLVISLSAAMALSAAVASYAAGWRIEDGSWIYEETSGALAVNEWKKGADNLWRYLDSGGHMAVNSWVDDVYYVDENGIMVYEPLRRDGGAPLVLFPGEWKSSSGYVEED